MRDHALSRRAVLAGGALAAVLGASGCRGSDWYPSEVTPDEYLLRAAIAEKERLVARYTAAIDAGAVRDPGLCEELRGHHERHLAVLRDRLPPRDTEPEVSASPGAPAPEATDEEGLRLAEEAAAANRLRQLGQATDPALAQLFASVGACEAGHVHLLSEA